MNKSKAVKAAIAFKRGMAFVRGMQQLAQDADIPEGARWITIGAAEGDDGKKHGGRNVLIDKESGTILKGLSKDVQGKTLSEAFKELKKTPEQKAAEQKAAEQKAAEQKAAEEKKAAEKKAAEKKAAEKKAAEQKAAEQKAAEQKAAEDYPYYEYGKRYRYDDLPSGFWDKWKADKQAIKDAGFQPIKIDGEWKLKTFEDANHKALGSIEAKNSANEKQKAEPMNTDNLPDKIFTPGEVPVIDQVDYKGVNDNYDYAKLKERRSKLNADIDKETARLEKEGQKTSNELTKMQYELKGVEGQIKKYPFYKDKKYEQDRFFGKDNYKFGDYGRIRHVIDRDTVILNIATDALRFTRNGDLQLNIAHDTAVYLKGFNVMPMRILTGNSWENIYAVKFNRKFYNPKPLDRSFDNAAFEKAPTFDDLVRVAKDQDLNFRYPQKVITPK